MAKVESWNQTTFSILWGCGSISESVTSKGIYQRDNPLKHSLIVTLAQLGTAIFMTACLRRILKPFNQTKFVAEMLTGIMLGPSVVKHLTNNDFLRNFYTVRQTSLVNFLEFFSIFMYTLLLSSQTDLNIVKNSGKLGWILGISSFVLPNILAKVVSTFLVKKHPTESMLLGTVSTFSPSTSFYVIIILLQDLKLLNSEIGRLAVSTALIHSICTYLYTTITSQIMVGTMFHYTIWDHFKIASPKFLFILFAAYGLRTIMFWVIKRIPAGKSLKRSQFVAMIMMIFGVGFFNESLGYSAIFGAMILGLVMPSGPPLGSGMYEKGNLFISEVLVPSYLLIAGNAVNIFLVEAKNVWLILMIVVAATVGKILAAVLPMKVFGVPNKDAFTLGLILCSQGIFDVFMAKQFLVFGAINQEYFTIVTLMIVLNSFIVTPVLKYIYDPSKRYINYKRRTIQHSRHETELKTLVCIHEEDDVWGLINVLKACYPTKKTPIFTYAVDLMELVGQIAPIFINHQFHKHQSSNATTIRTDRIINAFQQLETQYEGIKCHNFTFVAPYDSMHDDICTLALDKGVSLLIIPFKNSETISMRAVKRNVLDKSPCSVGILVNKRIVISRKATSQSFNACLVFLGGPDSREALALAMRILENPATRVTVISLIAEDDFISDLQETKLDTRAITELKRLFGNEGQRVHYQEVTVKDGAHTIDILRNIDNEYDIMLVGRRVDDDSPLVSGLADWTYRLELGIVGDVLASTDMKSTAPVLIIQQQSTVEDLLKLDAAKKLA